MVHARYRHPGGEDVSAATEARALAALGLDVDAWTLDPPKAAGPGAFLSATWNRGAARALRARIADFRPDVVHIQNFFPGLSPLAHRTAAAAGVPVVQTVRNWRLVCPAATRWRAGRPCDGCLPHPVPWPSLGRPCWRGSRSATTAAAIALGLHRAIRTWDRVAAFVCPSRAVHDALPARWPRRVVPNMAEDAAPGPGGEAMLYAGRLVEEKGLRVLAEAWRRHPDPPPLEIAGAGPLAPLFEGLPRVTLLGSLPHAEVLARMGRARAVLVPSLWPEPFGRTVIEAYARGTPVIATAVGGLPDLVDDGVTGLLVPPGSPAALLDAVERLRPAMRSKARVAFERRFAAPVVARRLVEVYESCP